MRDYLDGMREKEGRMKGRNREGKEGGRKEERAEHLILHHFPFPLLFLSPPARVCGCMRRTAVGKRLSAGWKKKGATLIMRV